MRIVIKVGTSTLAHPSGLLNIRRVEQLCKVMSDLENAGHELVLVSSGAIAMGVGKLSLKKKPSDIPTRQAAAAVGQCELMYTYDKIFSEYNRTVAQLLLTGADIGDELRRKNFENTLFRLLEMQIIPIINENDTIATEEIVIGDNDTLGAIVATVVDAQLLILLSDIDPKAKMIPVIEEITPEIYAMTGGAVTNLGTGGMQTKLHAAKITTEQGIEMVIANGQKPEILYDIIAGKPVGTRFKAQKEQK